MYVLVALSALANFCIGITPYLDCPVTEPPPILETPIVITYYDPSLGGINCNDDCSTLADGTKWTPAHYNNTAACLVQWRGLIVTVGKFRALCRDAGSMVAQRWNTYYRRWVVHVDILAPSIECNYCLYEHWSISSP